MVSHNTDVEPEDCELCKKSKRPNPISRKLVPTTKIEMNIPDFLLTEDNLNQWFPHCVLTQDSAMLLFYIRRQLQEALK